MRYELADPHLAEALHELLAVVLAVDAGFDCLDENCTPTTTAEVARA